MQKLILPSVFTLVWAICSASAFAADDGPVAWWKFDEGKGKVAIDSVTGKEDAIRRTFWYLPGVSGTAIKLDGFTTHIVRKAADAPRLRDAFTIEAWVAPQAYPYNFCAIVNHQRDKQAGYFFGIDAFARLGLHVAVNGKWQRCNTKKAAVPFMTKWTHIAGTFDKNKGLAVYVNGKLAAKRQVRGVLDFAEGMDLQIGRNHKKTRMDPVTLVRRDVNFETSYSFDGLIDELKIYDRPLSSLDILRAYASTRPKSAPALKWRKLPELPKGSGTFGASYY
ncbi:MAG: LamG domain-containing protein, partial [Planctomycetota bacterium]